MTSSTSPTRRHGRRIGLALALTGVIGGVGLPAYGLWIASVSLGQYTVGQGLVSFELTQDGSTIGQAYSATDQLTVRLGPPEASALLDDPNGRLAIAFTVQMRAEGSAGMNYDIALPTPDADTIFGQSDFALVPVQSPGGCTTSTSPAATPPTTPQVGIPAGDRTITGSSQTWCLLVSYTARPNPTYTNTATVAGSSPSGIGVQAATDWWVYVSPNPDIEPNADIVITHQVTTLPTTQSQP